jgi:hypothetical protein
MVKHSDGEDWSFPCLEAIACGTPVAAADVQTLRSALPDDTRWFVLGDLDGLGRVLEAERGRFAAGLRLAHRHTAAASTRLVELALGHVLAGRSRRPPSNEPDNADRRPASPAPTER